MYMDKLDGRIGNEFFDQKAAEFRGDQGRIMRDIETHQNANRSHIEEGVKNARTRPTSTSSVRESTASGKTKAARFCTFELQLEGWLIGGEIPKTL
jgi:hypothetical protein